MTRLEELAASIEGNDRMHELVEQIADDRRRALMETPDLWLCQYLCPSRHASMAMPYDRHEHTPEHIEHQLAGVMRRIGVRPVCHLCGSTALAYEHGKLPYTSWHAALQALAVLQAANLETRRQIDAARSQN